MRESGGIERHARPGKAPKASYAPAGWRVRAEQDGFRGIGWNGGGEPPPHNPPCPEPGGVMEYV